MFESNSRLRLLVGRVRIRQPGTMSARIIANGIPALTCFTIFYAEEPMPDLEMLDAPLNGNAATVNPIELIKEGGDNTWDEERQVANAKWG